MKIISIVILFLAVFEASGHICLDETNEVREKHGLGPYKMNSRLAEAARSHNDWMIDDKCFAHQCPNEPGLRERVNESGYYGFGRAGENIAAGYGSCRDVVNGWLNSPTHRRILLGNYVHVGCVFRKCSSCPYTTYWTCVYGTHFRYY